MAPTLQREIVVIVARSGNAFRTSRRGASLPDLARPDQAAAPLSVRPASILHVSRSRLQAARRPYPLLRRVQLPHDVTAEVCEAALKMLPASLLGTGLSRAPEQGPERLDDVYVDRAVHVFAG